MKRTFILVSITILANLAAFSAHASHIQVCGDVSGIWDVDTVNVLCDISVPANDTLIIMPGTIVLFQAYFKFNVGLGAVIWATGTVSEPIVFDERFAGNGWHGIRMSGSSDSSRFEHCLFRHGTASGIGQDLNGGGVYLFNSSPTLMDCIFDSCVTSTWSGRGGGLYCAENSNPIITNCLFQFCSGNSGAGIYVGNSSPIIIHNRFVRNGAWDGGGVCMDSSSATVDSNFFLANGASNSGSGVWCGNYSSGFIRYNTFDSNTTNNGRFVPQGGSIFAGQYSSPAIRGNQIINAVGTDLYANYSALVIQGCSPNIRENYINGNNGSGIQLANSGSLVLANTITNNRARGLTISGGSPRIIRNSIQGNSISVDGGGIFAENCSLKIKHNIITSNSAGNGAGIYFANVIADSICNNTITDNSATGFGGAILCNASNPLIQNCILYGNIAQGISQIHPMNGSTPIVRYCDVQGGWFGEGNIDIYPYFRDPGGNDYHLQSASNPICGDPGDSPCIDAGDPAIVDDTLSCDAGLGTLRSDMGAFGGYRQPVPIDDDDVIFPDNVRLLNNYPNPFNARTAIRFALAEPALVEIDVYDLLGRRVGALAPSFCEAGTQAITWDAGGNPSGTYFYRLVAGGKHTTGKMTLLK